MDNKQLMKKNVKVDLVAGLVVCLVALPLCLGVALASGASMLSGLISGIIGGIVVGAISSSQVGVSGPAAGLAVIVASSIGALGMEPFLVAVVLAGGFQVIAGLIKAGIVAHFFPSSVIKGMLSGIGVILILKQIPHAIGFDSATYEGDLAFIQADGGNSFSSILKAFSYIEPGAVIISVLCLGIIILMDIPKFKERFPKFSMIPSSLIVVLIGIGLNAVYNQFFTGIALSSADIEGGKVVSHLVSLPVVEQWSEYLTFISTPKWSEISNPEVWKVAITLFIVASLESLLSLEATDKIDPLKRHTSTNRELIAQGVGNIASGVVGGIPVTQVIVRSSANVMSGGKTKTSTITHGVLLLVFVLFIPKIINLIPLSSLAAILIAVGYKLASAKIMKEQIKMGYSQYMPYFVTIIGLVFTDMLTGIGIGMVVAVFEILRLNYNYSFFPKDKKTSKKSISIALPQQVNFLNAISFSKLLDEIKPGATVTIDGKDNEIMSSEFLEVIKDFKTGSEFKEVKVTIKNIKGIEDYDSKKAA
jgi:MFS superfamily sulfate permease-like transporter